MTIITTFFSTECQTVDDALYFLFLNYATVFEYSKDFQVTRIVALVLFISFCRHRAKPYTGIN